VDDEREPRHRPGLEPGQLRQFFRQQRYVRTLGKTVLMGAAVTAICLVFAVAVAYFLARYSLSRAGRASPSSSSSFPFWTSYLLGSTRGRRSSVRRAPQPGADGPRTHRRAVAALRLQRHRTFIVLIYVYMPFAILVLYASLERFDYTQLTAAQDLGASPSRAFRYILLPQIRPGLITAAIFVFIPILGEFLTPSMVGGASGLLIANLIQTFFKNALVPRAPRLGFLIVAFVTVLLSCFRKYLRVEDVYARG
jgi:spermidine/putrescine transport system permease protein